MTSLDVKENVEKGINEEKKICVNVRGEKFFLNKLEAMRIPPIAAWMERWKDSTMDEYSLDANPKEFERILEELREPQDLRDFLGLDKNSIYNRIDPIYPFFAISNTKSKLVFISSQWEKIKKLEGGLYDVGIETDKKCHKISLEITRSKVFVFSINSLVTRIDVDDVSHLLVILEKYRKGITPFLLFDERFQK